MPIVFQGPLLVVHVPGESAVRPVPNASDNVMAEVVLNRRTLYHPYSPPLSVVLTRIMSPMETPPKASFFWKITGGPIRKLPAVTPNPSWSRTQNDVPNVQRRRRRVELEIERGAAVGMILNKNLPAGIGPGVLFVAAGCD